MAKSVFYSLTLLLSSALVFLVQFLCAKMVLPVLGSTPAVWNTCLVFFQGGLLLGYAYAHLGPSLLGTPRHALLHLGMLAAAFFLLPIHLHASTNPPPEPVFWLLGLLTVGVGLPFFLLSSTGPLVQRWFAADPESGNPYALYAASNLGSMAGLISYPFLIEPNLTLDEQNQLWMWAFLALTILLGGCAVWLVKGEQLSAYIVAKEPWTTGWPTRLRWVLLALVPSSLMLSVSSYLTTDIAAIPLLWVAPLALYLLSFAVVFSWHPRRLQAWLARWLPGVVLLVATVVLAEGNEPIWLMLLVHLVGFFWIALMCHGQLASSKPPPEHLTEFYLWLAVGGVVGGLINALAAPLLFPGPVEYPLMLVLASWLNPRDKDIRAELPGKLSLPTGVFDLIIPLLIGLGTLGLVVSLGNRTDAGGGTAALMFAPAVVLCLLMSERPVRFGLSLAGLLLASAFYDGVHGKLVHRERSFFGTHRVTDRVIDGHGFRMLIHGNTVHGMQNLDPNRRGKPLTYYYHSGPIGKLFTLLQETADPRMRRVGLVGMGTGALAAYALPGQHWTFFEIDPAVVHIARHAGLFTFLKDTPGHVDEVVGDARLTLGQSSEKFGVLVIDAFGSDSIPLHLLTRQAMQVYSARLEPRGLLAFHISHRYLDLEPVLANLAREQDWTCLIFHDSVDPARNKLDHRLGKYASIWVLMAKKRADLPVLWPTARADPRLEPWTDDFSNIFQVLKLRREKD